MVLVALGVPVLAIVLLGAHTFYVGLAEPVVAGWPPPQERVQFPEHHPWARRALARVEALPPEERAALVSAVRRTIAPFPRWLAALNQRPVAVLCIGENHEPYLRRFLADRLFATLAADVLLLEATPEQAGEVRSRVVSGEAPVMLLEADLARLLSRALAANPGLVVDGIEERPGQLSARRRQGAGSREGSIEANFRARYRPGRRHVVLYGAFHCSHRGGWLFQRLRERPLPGAPPDSLLNLRVAWEHLEAPFEAFTYFLDGLGLPPGDIVITDPAALSAAVGAWFPFLDANELGRFGAIAVFRYRP